MGSTEKLKDAAEKVLGSEGIVKSFSVIGQKILLNFVGRRGAPWQAQLEFDDDGNYSVSNSHGSQTPGQLAREISRVFKEE